MNDRYDQKDLVWSADPNEFVRAHTAHLHPGSALDLGCGEGRNAIWLVEKGWTVVATDFSDVAISKASVLAEHRGVTVDLRVEDAAAVSTHDTHYDLIVIAYLHLEHNAITEIIARSARQLAAGGTMLIVGHHIENLERGHGGPPDISVLYDPAVIAGWLDDLQVVTTEEVTRSVEAETGPATAVDALVIARRPDPAARH